MPSALIKMKVIGKKALQADREGYLKAHVHVCMHVLE